MAEDGAARETHGSHDAGSTLRRAREAQGLDLAEVAARTRIPLRHLEAIEIGNYSALPSTTYAIGFARAYARVIGADEPSIAAAVRGEVAVNWNRPGPTPVYDEDPIRNPAPALVWGGVIVALVLVIAAGLYFGTGLFRRGEPVAATVPTTPAAVLPTPAPTQAPPAPANGQVTLTANDEVWVRVYDRAGKTLLIKTLAPGERYDVPGDADGPLLNIGRPDKLAITVNGSQVAPLGDGRRAMKDVKIDAASLLARNAAGTAGAADGNSSAP